MAHRVTAPDCTIEAETHAELVGILWGMLERFIDVEVELDVGC